jgi:penicillin-binding protein 1A
MNEDRGAAGSNGNGNVGQSVPIWQATLSRWMNEAPGWAQPSLSRLLIGLIQLRAHVSGRNRHWWLVRGIGACGLVFGVLLLWLAVTAPLSRSLQPIAPPRLTLVSADGEAIARSGAIIDAPVRMADLPPQVKQAFIAIEDRRFESHWGIDPRGIARATWANLAGGGVRQGGSTITQQLAKITFLTPERSLSRKAHEVLIAFWLEARLSKDEILERYLSNVYFGNNLYGLRAASMRYFYRQPEKLTLAQAAMLAGLVQAPSRLSPATNPKAAAARAQMVLAAMADCGFITPAQAMATSPARLDMGRVREANLPNGTYFADWAMPQARDQADMSYGEEQVPTTLDAGLQRAAERVIRNAGLGGAQAALVAMRTNGEVVAMVGGRNYRASSFNRATMALRQPGSTFKLFVYLAALRQGMNPDTKILDEPLTEGNYRPRNAGERYMGAITLREAFARSSNVAAIRLYRKIGPGAVIQAARDLGVASPLAPTPSLALGTSGMTLLELTGAYAGIAANDWPVQPHAIHQDEPGMFGRFWAGRRSFDKRVHQQMLDLLRAVVNQGTGRRAALGIDTYGKTGTSQNNRDALFIGFAGDMVVGVWVGNDDDTPLQGVSGSGLPAKIWHDFMTRAIKGVARAATKAEPKPVAADANAAAPLDLPELPEEAAVMPDASAIDETSPALSSTPPSAATVPSAESVTPSDAAPNGL